MLAGCIILLGLDAGCSASIGERHPPNIILILSDDQGSVDLHCYGSNDLDTPNLDRLAEEGLKFTQFYVAAPICAPSRGALHTGRYPHKNGIVKNGASLYKDEITIPEMLKPLGYRTAAVGKWHMGMATGGPNSEGYDYFFGHRGGCIENYKHNILQWDTGEIREHDLWRNDKKIHEDDIHFGELLVREANDFIEQNRAEPFFLYVAFNNPHYPVQPLPHHLEHYADLQEPRRSYAAFVSTLDEQVGKILDKVDELGLKENTLVIFLADQGHSTETRNALFIKDADPRNPGGGSAGPYRGHKFTLWEGGIRVPCIMSWPGTIPENQIRNQIATSMDILPTIAAYTGAMLPDKNLDGKSIRSIINSQQADSPHKELYWESGDMWAVRQGKWKLVSDKGNLFLTNLSADPGETTNLTGQQLDLVRKLSNLHNQFRLGY